MPRDANEIYLQRLRKKLDAVAADAIPHALAGEFDVVEQMIREINSDVYGWLAMARVYIAAIAKLGGKNAAAKDRGRILAMFERAVAHRELAYPMPHTKLEAEAYDEGKSQDRNRVVEEVGFDPSQWPSTED